MGRWIAVLGFAATACSKAPSTAPEPESQPARTKSSKAGFSADLAHEMNGDPVDQTGPRTNANGTAGAMEQRTTPPVTPPVTPPETATPDAPVAVVVATPRTPPDAAPAAAVVAVAPVTPVTPVTPMGTGPAAAAPPVVMTPELKAIKLTLAPNWDRDKEGAATFSLFVKETESTPSKVFVFHYGYEDPKAPTEREAYKKWLGAAGILTAQQDRQAGAAWYIQGVDASGAGAFRIVVNYGGKKLVCYGGLYRDADSDKLGDLRDDVVVDAKKICETISL